MRKLVIVVLVLLALGLAADRGAAYVAEGLIAQKVEDEEGVESAQVDVHGFPFLTQALSGDFKEIELSMPAVDTAIGADEGLTVEDVDSAVRLYRDALGLRLLNEPRFVEDAAGSSALGVDRGQYRVAFLQVPTSGLMLDLVDFKGADRKTVKAGIQDFGSTRMQIRVRDADAAIAAFAKFGGTVASTGGKSVELPAGNSTLKVVIVRDPNNLFVVLIESPPPAR